MEPAVYDKRVARAMFFDYYNTHKDAVTTAAIQTIDTLMAETLAPVRVKPYFYSYDFKAHKLISAASPQESFILDRVLLGRAMRDAFATATAQFAQRCCDPSIPNAEAFTLRYCQDKLLKTSGEPSIEAYIETPSDAFLGSHLIDFLGKVAQNRFVSSETKAAAFQRVAEQVRNVTRMFSQMTDQQHLQLCEMQIAPKIKAWPGESSYESYDEFAIKGVYFAVLSKSPLQPVITLNLPNHHVFITYPFNVSKLTIKAKEVFVFSKIGVGEKEDLSIKALGLAVDFCEAQEKDMTYTLEGFPKANAAGGKKFTDGIVDSIQAVFNRIQAERMVDPMMLNSFSAIVKTLAMNLPFDYVKQRMKLPADMTQETFKRAVPNCDPTVFFCLFFNVPRTVL